MYDYFCHLLFYYEYSLFVILWQQNLVVFNQIKKGKPKENIVNVTIVITVL